MSHACAIAIVIGLWQAAAGLMPPDILPPPDRVLRAGLRLAQGGDLWAHAVASLQRLAVGWVAGSTLAIGLVLSLEMLPRGAASVESMLALGYATPKIALLPVFIVWLGLGEAPKVLLLGLVTFFPVFITARAGIQSVEPGAILAARASGLWEWQILRYIRLPLAAPTLLAGLRVALGYGFPMLVTAELFATTQGLGYLILEATQRFDLAQALAVVGLLAGLNLVCTRGLLCLERACRRRTLGGLGR